MMPIKITEDTLLRREPFWMVLSPKGEKESYFGVLSVSDSSRCGIFDYSLELIREIIPGDVFHDGKRRYVFIGKGKRPEWYKWKRTLKENWE